MLFFYIVFFIFWPWPAYPIDKAKWPTNKIVHTLFASPNTSIPQANQKHSSNKWSQRLQKALEQSGISANYVGLMVLSANKTGYQLNADKLFIPASLIKIGTAGALLDLLSPSQTFTTQLRTRAPIKKSIIKGSLYLKGGGDPHFVSESLWNLVNKLTRTGLKIVQGDFIVDDSRFDSKTRGPRLSTPSHSSYDAPVSALSFNWNTINIYLRPGTKVGQPLRVHLDPSPLYFTSIQNQTQTAHAKAKKKLSIHRSREKGGRESLILKGQIPLGDKEDLIYKNILHPAIWTGWNAIAFLKQRGIEVKGQVKKGPTPSQAKLLAEWKSQPLVDQVKLMMKYSNNFMVEMLVKNLAVQKMNQKVGSHAHKATRRPKNQLRDGIKIIKEYWQKRGLPEGEYTLVQPSGLSRQNKIKPRHLVQLLQYWSHHPLQPEFESTFPLANEDGTLKKYFKNPALKGRVRAKTGNMHGVIGLAGFFIKNNTGDKSTFVFIFNGPNSLKNKAKTLFETWLVVLSQS